MKSEQLDQLASALTKAQAEMPAIPMTAVNPFLKSKYADLASMIRVASPVLTKHGLAISQQPVAEDGRIGVTTTLMHTSGQWIEDTISLPLGDERGKSLAQVAGSIITYLRRYSYGAICGLVTDEDADGTPVGKQHETPAVPVMPEPVKGSRTWQPGDPLSLAQAEAVTNHQGVRYGDLPDDKLHFAHKALAAKDDPQPEHIMKLAAIELILKAREKGGG